MTKMYPPGPDHVVVGGSWCSNRKMLVEAMVNLEDGRLVVRVPSGPLSDLSAPIFLPGGIDQRDSLRDALYALLTAIADDVQERFSLHIGKTYPGRFADDFIGRSLSEAVRRSAKTSKAAHSNTST